MTGRAVTARGPGMAVKKRISVTEASRLRGFFLPQMHLFY